MSELVGRRFGEFTIREPLSSGGFAEVFRAEQPALAREAVIKVLHGRHRGSETTVQRFLREAQVASRLDHPFAAHIYAFGAEPDGVLWIAMELVRGTPLDRLLATQGPIPLERFVPLVERLGEVIHTAHEQGIVHRDLKPGNVMVLARAGQLLPKLLDLGIAKSTGAAEPARRDDASDEPTAGGRLTEQGSAMGSPLYMAPEQWVDAASADARTDQYALGVLCYEALTGAPPFTGTKRVEIARAHARQPPPALGRGLPAALDEVIGRALAKKPADRFASILDFAAAFRAASGVEREPVTLPRLPAELRVAIETGAPQPLAQAVAALEAARNPHQARDAAWQIARVAVRLVGATALAGHAHVGSGATTDPAIGAALRPLARRGLGDLEWLELAAALCRPFAAIRDAHPVPELVALCVDGAPALRALLALRAEADAAPAGADAEVRALLDRAMAATAAALGELAFFADYALVVPDGDTGELWMGVRKSDRPRVRLRGARLAAGQPALVDADGVSVLSLWPYVQRLAPAPGAPEGLFFFDGKGRRGARLVALPEPFEREDDAVWDALGESLRETGESGPITDEDQCPFPGLAAFTRDDGARFFGRERETEAFVNRLRVTPLLAVIGPSGAGKSSFVQAGVLPALPDDWDAITVRPGPAPMAALAAKLGVATAAADELGALLRARAAPTTVLVVDQLEELFTLCEDPAERERYAAALAGAARGADDPVRVIVTLRDDFLLHAEALAPLRTRLAQALQLLTTPAAPELRRILLEPLARAGYELDDPALPDEVVATIDGTPGALALLSFTASKLWDLRDRRFRTLGRRAYQSLGGVGGALAQHAEATLREMPPEEQGLVREVFRHAVTAGGTRAAMSRAELEEVLGGGPHATAVIEKLVAARLLVAAEREDGGERVEITHEALLDAWPRLVTWRREDAEGAELRDQLRAAARQWDERGRPSGLLWRGDALGELRRWRARAAGALTAVEADFSAASFADDARGRRVRVGILVGAFVVLVAGVVALAFLNARANSNARELHDNLEHQYEDQGRRLVLAGEPLEGLAYLAEAAKQGASGAGHDFLIAQAVRASDGELFEVHHGAPVRSPRFSPDGTALVTAGLDDVADVWDARTGALRLSLRHQDSVNRASFSPDGALVATAAYDHTAALWDARTGARLHTLAHGGVVWCATFSPDGRSLLTVSDDDTVRLWDVATGAARLTLRGDGAGQHNCAYASDGARIAAGDNHGTTRVWDAATGRLEAELRDQHDLVRMLAFSPDGTRLVAASADATAVEYDVATARPLRVLAHGASVYSAVFSPDGRRIATASNDHTAVVWDADSGARLATLSGHAAGVNKAMFSPDGARVATVSDDATVRLWDAATGRPLARWIGHRDMILEASFDPSGQRIVSASEDGSAIVWSSAPHDQVAIVGGHTGALSDAQFTADGARVVSAGYDGTVRIADVRGARPPLVLRGHNGIVHAAAPSPDGRTIASAGDDATVRLWDAADGRALATLAHGGAVHDVSWSADGARLASACDDGAIRVWSASGALLREIKAHAGEQILSVRFAPDATLVSTSSGGAIERWDAATGARLAAFTSGDFAQSVAIDPTGRLAASPISGQAIRIWDLATGLTLETLVGHVGATNSAEWSPDGAFVVSGAMDGTARIWDATTGDEVAVLEYAKQVGFARFAPDGEHVITAADDGTFAIWELPRWRGSALDFDRLLRCRVPFRIEQGRLVPTPRDRSACGP